MVHAGGLVLTLAAVALVGTYKSWHQLAPQKIAGQRTVPAITENGSAGRMAGQLDLPHSANASRPAIVFTQDGEHFRTTEIRGHVRALGQPLAQLVPENQQPVRAPCGHVRADAIPPTCSTRTSSRFLSGWVSRAPWRNVNRKRGRVKRAVIAAHPAWSRATIWCEQRNSAGTGRAAALPAGRHSACRGDKPALPPRSCRRSIFR